jgi:hypothetical protein
MLPAKISRRLRHVAEKVDQILYSRDNFVPQYREIGDLQRLRGVIYALCMIVFIVSTLIAGAGLAVIGILSDKMPVYYAAPFMAGIVLLPMIAPSDYAAALLPAQVWAMLALLPVYIMRPPVVVKRRIGLRMFVFAQAVRG